MRSFMGCGWERDADEEGDKGPLSPTALEGDEWGFVACGLAGKLRRWDAGGDDRLEAYPTLRPPQLTRWCFWVATWGVSDKEAFVAYGLEGDEWAFVAYRLGK